jgi:O-antigen/teichoic acid export membrane protein
MIAVYFFYSDFGAGTFGAAHRITVSMHAVVWLWFFNLLPTWSASARQPGSLEAAVRRSVGVTAALGATLVAAVFVLAPVVIHVLYGEDYADSGFLFLRVLALVPALAWVSGNFRFGLIAKGALRAELAASVAGAAAGIGMLLVLAARSDLDAWKACWAFCGAEAVTLLVAWALWRRKSAEPASGPVSTAAR